MKIGINMKNKAFKTTVELGYHDGFQMTFENGCTISVQFSKHTYSDEGQTTAEVAAWDNQGNWLMSDGEKWSEVEEGSDVLARQTAGEVAKLIYTLSQW
jgi:hypothetical protein